jgi:hypothetical protein
MYLYDIFLSVWCLLNCVMSSSLHNVCSPVWCLLNCMKSAQLYDACIPVWCLLTSILSSYLYDVSSTVGCLFTCVLFSYLYDACLPTVYDIYSAIRCLPTYIDVCSTAWCLPTCVIYSHLCDVCSILYSKMSVYLNYVFLPTRYLLNCAAKIKFFRKAVFCLVKRAKFGTTTVRFAFFYFARKKN